ncbi:MAG: MFS transporter [Clostridia bacterium]|nr:MFS transporter [Clostridia bacterium]
MSAKRSKQASAFIALCAVVYFVSYITRNSYSSAITEITEALNTTRDMTGLVGTAAFLTYGLGQIVCGVLGDCIAPRYMILMGVGATSVCNLLMPFMGGNVTAMIVLWGVNGFAQAMFWPPLVRLMAEHLSGKDYNDAVVAVTTASSVGNIFVYILSPVCIAVSGWNLIFYVTGIAGFVMMAVWFLKTRVLPVPEEKDDGHGHKSSGAAVQSVTQKVPFVKMAAMSGLFVILLCIILQGMLRDGLTTWMPSLISDTFDLSNAASILTGVVLPLFAIVSIKSAAVVQDRVRNEVLCAAIFFGIGFVCSVLMLPLFERSVVLSVILMALITACMHGVNLMLITRAPIHFARFGKISTMSGLLNAFTYIGSAASTYGFALLSDRFGWYFTIGSWVVTAGAGMLLCLTLTKKWKKFTE